MGDELGNEPQPGTPCLGDLESLLFPFITNAGAFEQVRQACCSLWKSAFRKSITHIRWLYHRAAVKVNRLP